MSAQLTLLVGPPGSGKSTMAHNLIYNDGDHGAATVYVNQDKQGAEGHMEVFNRAVSNGQHIIVDRMNFNKQQREKYISVAKKRGYKVVVRILCESSETCLHRMLKRENHPTIKDEKSARSALQTFMTKYEPPEESEGIDVIKRFYPKGLKPKCIVVDLDGTLCNVEHRRHFVRPPADFGIAGRTEPVTEENPLPKFKKNWKGFFDGIKDDTVNVWCLNIVRKFQNSHEIVFCSGRSDNYKKPTVDWLLEHAKMQLDMDYSLYMRHRHDPREDYLVKEIILDFEILTRYSPEFMIDDRKQVVDMWRRRGFVCLHCDEGDF